jgi:hypothetical protein
VSDVCRYPQPLLAVAALYRVSHLCSNLLSRDRKEAVLRGIFALPL